MYGRDKEWRKTHCRKSFTQQALHALRTLVCIALRMPRDPLTFTNLEELEEGSKSVLSEQAYGYYSSGAESEATVRFNRDAFESFKLLPRMLVDVSNVHTSVTILGRKLAFPVMVAPMAMQRMAHEDGELAVARAAGRAGIPMVVSTMATTPLKDVGEECRRADVPLTMFQLYVITDRDVTKQLIQDAEKAGYDALVVTVDAPQLGRREADEKSNFKLPAHLKLDNLGALYEKTGRDSSWSQSNSAIAQVFASHVDPSLTWEFLKWVRQVSRLPVFVKGILSPLDAELALQAGVDGIIVSNHGGRQIDFAPSGLEMLPSVAQAVRGRVPLWVDGGVRRGTDIIKALILGADGVLLGRPVLYGLALGGQAGVDRVLALLAREFKLALQLLGCPSVQNLSRSHLIAPWDNLARL